MDNTNCNHEYGKKISKEKKHTIEHSSKYVRHGKSIFLESDKHRHVTIRYYYQICKICGKIRLLSKYGEPLE